MQNTTNPTGATELDQFLAGMVADAADELAAENLTEFDRFLAGLVADAAAELAVEDAEAAAEAARAVAPVYHTSTAVHGPVDSVFAQSLARIMAELDSPEIALLSENPIDRATRTGRIGGSATPRPESGGCVLLSVKNNATARFRKMPDRHADYPCSTPNWITGTDHTGEPYDIPKPCEKCINCVAYAQECKIVRWENGRGDLQTTINITGFANADESRQWTGGLSKALGKLPVHSSVVTEHGEVLLAFVDTIGADLVDAIEHFAAAEHGNCKRPAVQCVIKVEEVHGVDLAAFCGRTRTALGERRHISWILHGDTFATPTREDDFALGPGRPLPDGETPPAKPQVSDAVSKSRARWRKVIAPRTRQTMREGERATQALAWCAGKNLITYCGPPKLLRQYADFKAGKRDYEPAWDYVAAMVGDDAPTPWRQPRDCKGCGFPYYPTPGRRQCANCEGE